MDWTASSEPVLDSPGWQTAAIPQPKVGLRTIDLPAAHRKRSISLVGTGVHIVQMFQGDLKWMRKHSSLTFLFSTHFYLSSCL